ncbi:MAG: hypothetical protein OEW85_08225 [Acidimicrobiia bacterium]|nr:hypothetical protein [Acidimicrobiia bacterium]
MSKPAPSAPLDQVDPDAVASTDSLGALDAILGHGVSWFGRTDAVALVLLREHLEMLSLFRQRLSLTTPTPADIRAYSAAVRVAVHLLGRLGLTPSDRSSLGLSEVVMVSKLDQLRQQWESEDEERQP